mmetsp:Transcript_16702/g.14586  ORF Transcript_16702/g.14586 Transcript_16702/m.14586 type:complete len:135 (+) Transcript_16702:122-526(+)
MGAGDTSKHLMELKYRSFDPKHPEADVKNHVYATVDVKINTINLNIFMQPLLRMVDFLTGQLLPSLRGDVVPQYTPLPKLDHDVAKQNLDNPMFMDMHVFMESPIINLRPLPDSTEYIKVKLGDLTVKSSRIKS